MNRGDRREAIFQDDEDKRRFIQTLAEACTKTKWVVNAYCLMSNHFHLVVETPQANLVAGIQWLLSMQVERLLGALRIGRDSPGGRQQLADYMEARRWQEDKEANRQIRRGWCFGDEGFRQELLAEVEVQRGPNHLGAERQESQVERAERLLQVELSRQRWTEEDLRTRLKTDALKLAIARKLRRESTITLRWIAQRLQMGSVNTLRNALRISAR